MDLNLAPASTQLVVPLARTCERVEDEPLTAEMLAMATMGNELVNLT